MVKRETPIPERKTRAVKDIEAALKNKRTVMICSISNLPSSQFQEIKKKMKGQVEIRVFKKNIFKRGLASKKEAEELGKYIGEHVAIAYSDLEPFELSAILGDEKSPAKAKVGQEVPQEIAIEPGPTDIPPGPAISEFGALGIKVGVEAGKIAVKERKVVLKAGDKVTPQALAIMAKLNINPFSVGLEPVAAYDRQENKVYGSVRIDKKGTLAEFIQSYSKALAFAVTRGYECKESIGFILAKAAAEGKAIESLIKTQEQPQGGQ